MDRRTLLTVAWRILCRAHRTEMALAVTLATSRPSMGRGPGDSGGAVCVAPPHPGGRGRGWRGGSGGALGTCRVASAETPVQPGLAEGAAQSSGDRARVDMPWTPASGWGRCRGAAVGAALRGLGLPGGRVGPSWLPGWLEALTLHHLGAPGACQGEARRGLADARGGGGPRAEGAEKGAPAPRVPSPGLREVVPHPGPDGTGEAVFLQSPP